MTDYRYPRWRQIPFLAVLIIILVLNYAPSITQGTVHVRVYAQIPPGPITHLYTRFNYVQLHTAGLPPNTGSITLNNLTPRVDLVPTPGQFTPSTLISTTITSGRYDSLSLIFSNSTIVNTNNQRTPITTGPILNANATIPVPPNGNGDILILLTIDYNQLIATSPTINARITQVTAL